MKKKEIYERKLKKLNEIFQSTDPNIAEMAEGLIDDFAFLESGNAELKQIMKENGMVRIHPEYPELQKPSEATAQYLKNVNSYANVVNKVIGIYAKNIVEDDDDELKEFE